MSRHFNFEKISLSKVPKGLHLVEENIERRHMVLVVDDEPLIADTLVAILRIKNFSAHAAYSGEQAMVAAAKIQPDILVTDVMMPSMNGIDLAVALKEIVPDCAVLLFSGHVQLDHLLDDPRSAVHDFPLLSKPIHPDELLLHISKTIGSAA